MIHLQKDPQLPLLAFAWSLGISSFTAPNSVALSVHPSKSFSAVSLEFVFSSFCYIEDVKPSWFAYLPGEILSEGICVSRSPSVLVSILSAACMELCRCSRRSCWWRRAGCRQHLACSLFKIQLCIYLSETPWSFVKSCKLNFESIADRSLFLMWASLLRWLASWSEEMEVRDLLNLLLLRVSAFDTVSRDCTDLFFSVNSLHPCWVFDGRFL